MPALGRRGGGWVIAQSVLLGVIVVACVAGPRWPQALRGAFAVVGIVVLLCGVVVAVVAIRALGPSLTPFPRPVEGGRLVVEGPYRLLRHPIYAAGLLVLGGLSLALSPFALGLTALLAVVWALKIVVEERFLRAVYAEYGTYCEQTRWRLVPFVF